MARIARVVVDIAHNQVDRAFDYLIPEQLQDIAPGSCVTVPFGHIRRLQGYVVGVDEQPQEDLDRDGQAKLKEVLSVIKAVPPIPQHLITLALWVSRRYHCLLVDALRLVLMPKAYGKVTAPKSVRQYRWAADISPQNALQAVPERSVKQRALVEAFFEKSQYTAEELNLLVPGNGAALKALVAKQWLGLLEQQVAREPYPTLPFGREEAHEPTIEQQAAMEEICEAIRQGTGNFLLHGVTGSGKTEVYFHCIQQALEQGRTAMILVPEISLTPQMIGRFRARFGALAAVMHSRLSEGERQDEWRRINSGQARVAIGARSAVFAPLADLGLIIIDEEHENSYISEHAPRYDAIEVAARRAQKEGAALVLGSATPSVERYFHATQGRMKLLKMLKRVREYPMPEVEVVDMREELARGNRGIFSAPLYRRMQACIEAGEQMILFLNRRGYSTFISCRQCGYVAMCPQCDVSMTYHLHAGRMRCHYCGAEEALPKLCPSCGSPYIKHFGVGTQKVQQEFQKLFPDVRVLRMDADTTGTKQAHLQMLKAFAEHEAQVLIGTQMVAKGLDFPDVTLVGIVAADVTLNLADFRSPERGFQLITQAAGRAGRDKKTGFVVLQTYNPDHASIVYARQHDYEGFFAHEIEQRRASDFPPFGMFVRFLFSHEDEAEAERACRWFADILKADLEQFPEFLASRPVISVGMAPISRIQMQYRWQLIVKMQRHGREQFLTDRMYHMYRLQEWKNVSVHMDVNPLHMI